MRRSKLSLNFVTFTPITDNTTMIKATKFYVFTLFFLTISVLQAQTYTNDGTGLGVANLQSKAAQFSFISSTAITPQNVPNASFNNAVYILQIGDENNVVTETRSVRSTINVLQRGNKNEVNLDLTAGVISENIIQQGVSNRFIDLTNKPTLTHSATVFQTGRNQNLIMAGNNSISDKMIVNMRGKNQTVLIRNFKR